MPSGVYPRKARHGDFAHEKQAFTVRLDAPVYLKLLQRAKKERRSLTAQIEIDLERLYEMEKHT